MSHSAFTINSYLVDENGDYILTEAGDRIIIGSTSIVQDGPYRRLGGVVRRDIKYIRSFQVSKRETDWLLKVNQHQLVGRYPTQMAALQVLVGLFTRIGSGDDHYITQAMSAMLSKGDTSFIDSAVNDLVLSRDGIAYNAALSDYNPAEITPAVGTHYLALQYSDTDGNFTDSGPFTDLASFKDIDSDATIVDGVRNYNFGGGYSNQPEDTTARILIIDMDSSFNWTVTNVFGAPTILKDEVKTLLFVGMNPSVDVTLSNETIRNFTAFHTGSATDVQYTWTISGDTDNVTSDLSATGRFYTLTWNEVSGPDEVVTVEVAGSSVQSGTTVSSPATTITLDQDDLRILEFTVGAPIDPDGGAPEIGGDPAQAVYVDQSVGGSATFTHEWFMELSTLTGLTIENQGGGS